MKNYLQAFTYVLQGAVIGFLTSLLLGAFLGSMLWLGPIGWLKVVDSSFLNEIHEGWSFVYYSVAANELFVFVLIAIGALGCGAYGLKKTQDSQDISLKKVSVKFGLTMLAVAIVTWYIIIA